MTALTEFAAQHAFLNWMAHQRWCAVHGPDNAPDAPADGAKMPH